MISSDFIDESMDEAILRCKFLTRQFLYINVSINVFTFRNIDLSPGSFARKSPREFSFIIFLYCNSTLCALADVPSKWRKILPEPRGAYWIIEEFSDHGVDRSRGISIIKCPRRIQCGAWQVPPRDTKLQRWYVCQRVNYTFVRRVVHDLFFLFFRSYF